MPKFFPAPVGVIRDVLSEYRYHFKETPNVLSKLDRIFRRMKSVKHGITRKGFF